LVILAAVAIDAGLTRWRTSREPSDARHAQ
jgi:hypothetical protein